MSNQAIGDNRAMLRGVVAAEPVLSHTLHGITFFRFPLRVPRLSGREDVVNVLLPAALLRETAFAPEDTVEVTGEIRSFNNRSGIGSRLVITLFAREIRPTKEEFCNTVKLRGVLCKAPVYRRTPFGREICDLLLAVNRGGGGGGKYRRGADYLPCIAWGSLAQFCSRLSVGNPLRLNGRLQSRQYSKNLGKESLERTAFEISVMSLENTDTEIMPPVG